MLQQKTADQSPEDEGDYMNMVIAEPTQCERETYTERRRRKEREAARRARPKSKLEIAAEEQAAREAALARSLLADPGVQTNKGLAMMTKMGFQAGVPLGRPDNGDARLEPVRITIKQDRGGIGLDAVRKREVDEQLARDEKRVKVDADEYRERVRQERELARLEGLVDRAMRVAESLGEREEMSPGRASPGAAGDAATNTHSIPAKPLKVNLLWRGLVRKREERERERRMRYDLHQSLSRLPTYEDTDEDKIAVGKELSIHTVVEDVEEEDTELDEFNNLDPADRLEKLVAYLRSCNYCFWCKYTYPNNEMDGCPGLTEEDHD